MHARYPPTSPQPKVRPSVPSLRISRLLRIAAHDLDLIRLHRVLIVQLEIDILDQKCPDIIAEAVGIQMTLRIPQSVSASVLSDSGKGYLEIQPSLHFVCQHFRNRLVEGRDDLHSSLRLESA